MKTKEDTTPAAEKPVKKKEAGKEKRPGRMLPDEAYQLGCWVCGGQHRRDKFKDDKSVMVCEMCGMEESRVTQVCLRQWTNNSPAGNPVGRPPTPAP